VQLLAATQDAARLGRDPEVVQVLEVHRRSFLCQLANAGAGFKPSDLCELKCLIIRIYQMHSEP
jgi:hypothetical protein